MLWSGKRQVWGIDPWTNDDQGKDVVPGISLSEVKCLNEGGG